MKKLLCLLLSISMLVSMITVIGASGAEIGKAESDHAPEGTPIGSAAEFAAMKANEKYYLTADITISAPWNAGAAVGTNLEGNNAFTGSFDGNGHTITTTVPVFATLAGNVKNLTIEGNVKNLGIAADGITYNAALAVYGCNSVVIENVYNKATVAKADAVGGIISIVDIYSNGTLEIVSCRNDADLASNRRTGGMVCYVTGGDAKIDGCINTGDMYSSTGTQYTYVGGMIAQFGKTTTPYPVAETAWLAITNCENTGKISADRGYCAGMAAFSYGHIEIIDSVNRGEIENVGNADGKAAGIYCCPTTRDKYCSVYIKGCVNYATVKGAYHAAGIAALLGNGDAESSEYNYFVKSCANYGDIYLNPNKVAMSSSMRAGGIVAYAYGGSTGNGVINCINAGNITVDMSCNPSKAPHVGGIIGYVNGQAYMFKNNLNLGSITFIGNASVTPCVAMTVFNNTTKTSLTQTSNNYTVDGGSIPTLRIGANANSSYVTVISADKIATGEAAYLVNEGAGKPVFFQKIGKDQFPVVVPDGTNYIDKEGENTYVNIDQMPSTDDEDAPVKPGTPEDDPGDVDLPGDHIPSINIPDKAVTLPAADKFGKVDAAYKPEGTAITSADDFAKMTVDGKYYLANDITISATWNNGRAVSEKDFENIAFRGNFDGNGHKITTSVPLFANLGGTVKNLTVEGEIKESTQNRAVIALWTATKVNIENVYNKANILGGEVCGSMLAYAHAGAQVYITACRNDGNIKGKSYLGGLLGYAENRIVHIKDSVNCGNVTSELASKDSYSGGLVGRVGYDIAIALSTVCRIENSANYGKISAAANYSAGMLAYINGFAHISGSENYGTIINRSGTAAGIFAMSSAKASTSAIQIEDCRNYGNIGSGAHAAGIVGHLGKSTVESYFVYFLTGCANYGDIYSTVYSGVAETVYVGGIAGYAYGGESANGLTNSVNAGKVTVNATSTAKSVYVGGVLGYVNGNVFKFSGNINAGAIENTGTVTSVALMLYNKHSTSGGTRGNYTVACGSIPAAKIGTNAAPSAAVVETVTAERLASGEIACLVNTAAGEDVMYQNLGSDAIPTPDRTHKIVVKNADGTYSNKESEVVTPPAPENTTTPPTDETTKTPTDDTTTEPTDNTTKAPDVTTEEPKQNGCGGVSLAATLFTVIVSAFAFVVIKKKN